MTTLNPCPFCGGESLLRERYINGAANTKHYIRECRHCKATFANWYRSIKKANEAWNRRAQPDNEPLTLEQLRNMDGEPVWLKDGIGEGWFLASAIVGEKIYFCEKSITVGEPITGCGKTWLAYAHKPGGEQE